MALKKLGDLQTFLLTGSRTESKLDKISEFNQLIGTFEIHPLSQKFPWLEKRFTHEKQRRSFGRPPAKKARVAKESKNTAPSVLHQLVQEALEKPVNEHCWQQVLSADFSKVVPVVEEREKLEVQEFYSKYHEAKVVWSCFACESYGDEINISGFVECNLCGHSYHHDCVKFESKDKWLCMFCLD